MNRLAETRSPWREHRLEWCVRDQVGRDVEMRERRADVWEGSLLGKQRTESRREWVLARVVRQGQIWVTHWSWSGGIDSGT